VEQWAQEEFGGASLGDARRTARLVRMAARAASDPAGRVTEVFDEPAERLAAYRFLESRDFHARGLCDAASAAAVRRADALGHPFVFVPVDGSSLSFSDPEHLRELGSVGAKSSNGRGLEVMSAILVEPDGVVLGLGAQHWWMRSHQRVSSRLRRTLRQRETHHWLDVIEDVLHTIAREGAGTRPWFQLDRGGDFKELLAVATDSDGWRDRAWLTVRATTDRRVVDRGGPTVRRALTSRGARLSYELNVPARPGRPARHAVLDVHAAILPVAVRGEGEHRTRLTRLGAVLVRETGKLARGVPPIDWLLWTTHPVATTKDVRAVVTGYATRWRIEEFHRTWKSECRTEQSQLHTAEALKKWATINAAVATRVERLKRLAREQPQLPAADNLSIDEIDALVLLRNPPELAEGASPTIGQAVRWIADLGGYTGPTSSGGPPGATVISRGLERLKHAAEVVGILRERKTSTRRTPGGRRIR
jgi:hypothetical protein